MDLALLMRYKRWANEKMFAALSHVPAEELTASRPIVFGSILRTMNHVRAMDLVWKAHMEGKPHGLTTRNPPTSPALDEVRRSQAEIDAWFVSYAEKLSAQAAREVVEFEFIGGGRGALERSGMLLHVVNHGTYHRGNVASMLYQIGRTPPTTDLPVFLRDVQTA